MIIDPKGSQIKESTHKVTTLDMAKTWFEGVTEYDLPVTIYQQTAKNGRCFFQVINVNGTKIHEHG